MESGTTLVYAGGVFDAAPAVFHGLFWRLFRWREQLARPTSLDRAVVQVLDLALTLVFFGRAWLGLAHAPKVVASRLGRSLPGRIAVFWLLCAIAQIGFFGALRAWSVAYVGLFLVGAGLHAAPPRA